MIKTFLNGDAEEKEREKRRNSLEEREISKAVIKDCRDIIVISEICWRKRLSEFHQTS